jgi:hypothetical protein
LTKPAARDGCGLARRPQLERRKPAAAICSDPANFTFKFPCDADFTMPVHDFTSPSDICRVDTDLLSAHGKVERFGSFSVYWLFFFKIRMMSDAALSWLFVLLHVILHPQGLNITKFFSGRTKISRQY